MSAAAAPDNVAGKLHEVAWRHELGWWARRKRAAQAKAARRETGRVMRAIRRAALTPAEKAITRRLAGMWLHWRKRGWMDPSVAEIAAHVGRDRRTVQRVMARLEAAGWIVWDVTHRGGRGIRRRMRVNLAALRSGLSTTARQARERPACGIRIPFRRGNMIPRRRPEKGGTTRARSRNYTVAPCGSRRRLRQEGDTLARAGWFTRLVFGAAPGGGKAA